MRRRLILRNLSAEDQRTYRRWTAGLYLFYAVAIILATGVTYLTRPASDPGMTQMARLKPAAASSIPPATSTARQ
jgi:hypothetical protein